MKCTARNIRILTSEEMLTILRKSATLYSEYVDTTLLFIFRKSKSDSYDYYEVRFGKNNFMHLAGIKSGSLNANEFYEACISGEITREQCKPRRDASTMYSKIGVMEKILDLRNSKCYKIGEKDWLNHKFCGISDSSRSSVGSYRIASERNIRHQDIRIPVCEES